MRALSGVLVVAQVAVALMLLTGAGLLIQSFAEALRVDTGLEATNVVTARIALTRQDIVPATRPPTRFANACSRRCGRFRG